MDYPSGIDEISGGTFDGEIGVLLIEAGAYINTISGGTFQVDNLASKMILAVLLVPLTMPLSLQRTLVF